VASTEDGTSVGSSRKVPRKRTVPSCTAKPSDDRTIGLVEVEVAVELLLGRLAGVAAVATALLVAQEAGRHRCGTRTFREGEGAC
jgi:hypothetical protein